MKNMIFIFVLMFAFGYLLSDVGIHYANMPSHKKNEIGKKYYPVLYRLKEEFIYPMHNPNRVKSYQNGMNGVQVMQFRYGYKVKR